MDHKLTTRSQEAVANALRLAQDAGNPSFEPIHLLAALLQDHEGIAFQVLNEVADTATIENTTRAALAQLPSSTGESVAEPNPTQATLKVVRLAGDEASDNGDDYVSTEHLLVGLALNEGQVGKILNDAGASAKILRKISGWSAALARNVSACARAGRSSSPVSSGSGPWRNMCSMIRANSSPSAFFGSARTTRVAALETNRPRSYRILANVSGP